MSKQRDRDPVAKAADGSRDLYDVASWEERTSLDGLAVAVYWLLRTVAKVGLILVALVILAAITLGSGLLTGADPLLGVMTALSVLPALALVGYVWYSDVTTGEPLSLLVATFLLSIVTANFAVVFNSVLQAPFNALGGLGMVLFFFVVVGPVEETVKLLAVRLYAYNSSRFDSVVDGAVYGAVAGLGFATIENFIYIARQVGTTDVSLGLGLVGAGGGITAIRALAGPGHVIYSAFAGYYLGLAKFNGENAGPIVVKGLIIAAFIHAAYNSTVGIASGLIEAVTGLPGFAAFLVYILLYDGLFGLLLLRKIRRYSRTYQEVHDGRGDRDVRPEATEFE
ncbi:PrsW family intramembrane metalloprotease [Halobium salinum]|uniref:PrsW family intramembrane metalloprotease n=1 Tax=Halobium salinum TaxID=1364940 RepID=A0ABD5PBG7_9EURY|nr:PrsW family intramembrane metalloprotease [Halobium salinum]